MMHAIFESLPSRTVFNSSISSLATIVGAAPELALVDEPADVLDALDDFDELEQPESKAAELATAAITAEPPTNVRRETREFFTNICTILSVQQLD